MKKDAYKDIFQGWIAKAAEYKMALAVAAACTVIILISLLWPKPRSAPTINAVNTAPPASHVYTAPATPAPPPSQQPTSQQPTSQNQTAPPAPAPSPMEKELAAKPLFPPSPATPKPAPASQQSAPVSQPQTPPPPAASPHAAMELPSGWYVQLGSFRDKQKAVALARKIEDKHWQSRLAPRPGGLHAVWVGPYQTRAEVDKAKLTLKKDTGISGFVVKAP